MGERARIRDALTQRCTSHFSQWVDPPISLCLREQADLPREDLWEPTKDGKVQITDCSNGIANCQVQVMTVEDAVASQAEKWAGMVCTNVAAISVHITNPGPPNKRTLQTLELACIGFFPGCLC